ncbi:putative integral membrane protein [Colletotrichum sublineola]|uniref:Putative integral membrane protein n=1 Tax=Colletotrichum sublineola TaxID=1173701 RepID=A0A066WTM7_COLSU|nr:putative integral membrane protein [Colletotrichum sublineola]
MDNEEVERIAEIVRNLSQVPVGNFSTVIQVIAYVMSALSVLVVSLRIYVRVKLSESKKTWGPDDTFAVLGCVFFLPSVAFLIIGTDWGLGAHDTQIPEGSLPYYQIKVKQVMFSSEVPYFASTVLTKISLSIMIVRLSATKIYAYILWTNMGVLVATMIVCMIVLLTSCEPVPALWNEKLGFCRNPNGWMYVSHVGSVVLAMVDWTCAITPFFLIRGLQMPKRRKISLQVILGLGIIGSAAGLVRMGYYHAYDTVKHPNESLYNWGQTVLWTVLEGGLGIIACSLPPLRKLVSAYYRGSSNGGSNKSRAEIFSKKRCGKRRRHGEGSRESGLRPEVLGPSR